MAWSLLEIMIKKVDTPEPGEHTPSSARMAARPSHKELYWILGVMAGILAILFLTPLIFENIHTIVYKGLTFTKEKDSANNLFYHYFYYFTDAQGQQYKHNIYLRIDPRENNVSVDGTIIYPAGNRTVYYTINGTGLSSCPNSLRDVSAISTFLTNNLFEVVSGTPDTKEAKDNNLREIRCDMYPDTTVIQLQASATNITTIVRKNQCYIISVANCEILAAVEKFEIQSLLDAKQRSS